MEEPEEVEETEEVTEVEEPEEVAPAEGEAVEELEEIEEIAAEEEEVVEEAVEEEAVEAEEAKEEVEERKPEIVEERIYTIPLGRAWVAPRRKRAPRAMSLLRAFVERHMKVGGGTEAEGEEETERLVISNEVNEEIWRRGIEKPPRRVRVRAAKDVEGTVTVYLAEGD